MGTKASTSSNDAINHAIIDHHQSTSTPTTVLSRPHPRDYGGIIMRTVGSDRRLMTPLGSWAIPEQQRSSSMRYFPNDELPVLQSSSCIISVSRTLYVVDDKQPSRIYRIGRPCMYISYITY